MANTIKLCLVVIVGLMALSHFTVNAEQKSSQSDQSAAPSERFFDLSSWGNRYPYNTYTPSRPYYTGGYYPNQQRPYYPNQYYPTTGWNTNGWNTNGWASNGNGYGNNNGYLGGTGNGGYGGFGGNGGLTTYYGYGRDDYAGDRNMGFGYQQGTNINGFSRDGDRNLNYNSYPTSASSSDYYY